MSRRAGTCLLRSTVSTFVFVALASWLAPSTLTAQGVTTAQLTGFVTDTSSGAPLADASVTAVHLPSGTSYRALVRSGGTYTIPNMRIGGALPRPPAMIGHPPRPRGAGFLHPRQRPPLPYPPPPPPGAVGGGPPARRGERHPKGGGARAGTL